MSNWNSLESNLRKWAPRQPSPELRKGLFRETAPVLTRTRIRFTDFSQWLVPAFGCFLLVAGTLSSRTPMHPGLSDGRTNFLFSDNGRAYSEMSIASHADHSDINSLPAGRLEWTFGTRPSGAVAGSTLVSYTNKIIH